MDLSDEPLSSILASHNLPVQKELYTWQNRVLFLSMYHGQVVVVKIVRYKPNPVRREGEHLFLHRNVVQLVAYVCEEGPSDFFEILVMERMELDLKAEIKQRKDIGVPWSSIELIDFLRQVVDALETAQRQGISHRDIKPGNILKKEFTYKLADFGLSKIVRGDRNGTVLGTENYLSPLLRRAIERNAAQATHNPYKSDVFALGLTVLAMANFETPKFRTANDLEAGIIPMVDATNLSQNLKVVLRSMLAVDEAQRPDFLTLSNSITSLCAVELHTIATSRREDLSTFATQPWGSDLHVSEQTGSISFGVDRGEISSQWKA